MAAIRSKPLLRQDQGPIRCTNHRCTRTKIPTEIPSDGCSITAWELAMVRIRAEPNSPSGKSRCHIVNTVLCIVRRIRHDICHNVQVVVQKPSDKPCIGTQYCTTGGVPSSHSRPSSHWRSSQPAAGMQRTTVYRSSSSWLLQNPHHTIGPPPPPHSKTNTGDNTHTHPQEGSVNMSVFVD
jgi:hypothetical protein